MIPSAGGHSSAAVARMPTCIVYLIRTNITGFRTAILAANLAGDWGRPGCTRGLTTAATSETLRFSA
jgi:hypothetical protein